jgi:hypothetical protein
MAKKVGRGRLAKRLLRQQLFASAASSKALQHRAARQRWGSGMDALPRRAGPPIINAVNHQEGTKQ